MKSEKFEFDIAGTDLQDKQKGRIAKSIQAESRPPCDRWYVRPHERVRLVAYPYLRQHTGVWQGR
jgi:hypothetical protein